MISELYLKKDVAFFFFFLKNINVMWASMQSILSQEVLRSLFQACVVLFIMTIMIINKGA